MSCYGFRGMAVRKCVVSYRDASGVSHGVSVRAEGVREACCLALAEFKTRRKDGDWGEPPGDATELTVEVLPPPTTHVMKVAEVKRWLETTATDPAQSVAKSRLKRLLG
jgi:hypothetical protein